MSYIAIVDYGAGNLMSVHNTLDFLGCENRIADMPETVERAAGVILPGVGAFPDAMQALADSGLLAAVKKASAEKPFLGIFCSTGHTYTDSTFTIDPHQG